MESGEGIESQSDGRGVATRAQALWNPVKELKDSALEGREVANNCAWNPVKELKVF